MKFDLQVDSEHLPYLQIQKGNLDHLKHNRVVWLAAYSNVLIEQFISIRSSLPAKCNRFLDVGSGLGGIDVLIRRHYEETTLTQPEVALLDGVDDPPEMTLHRKTFNSMRITRNYQVKNGLSPNKFWYYGPETIEFEEPFDLVVSFGSWCFHYPPDVYLPALMRGGIKSDTVMILDVRKDRPAWMHQLEAVLIHESTIVETRKWSRMVFKVKP